MTYGYMYDQFLNEIYRDGSVDWDELPSWVTGGKDPAELMKENDPTMYRCGFCDWTDSLRDDDIKCDCGNAITDFDVDEDDEVECGVCKGTHFECANCGDVCEKVDHAHWDDDVCDECYEAEEEAEGENETGR